MSKGAKPKRERVAGRVLANLWGGQPYVLELRPSGVTVHRRCQSRKRDVVVPLGVVALGNARQVQVGGAWYSMRLGEAGVELKRHGTRTWKSMPYADAVSWCDGQALLFGKEAP